LKKMRIVNQVMKTVLNSERKIVMVRRMSITAPHTLSVRCSISISRNLPRKSFFIAWPSSRTSTSAKLPITCELW
jgi:hypothetical protein